MQILVSDRKINLALKTFFKNIAFDSLEEYKGFKEDFETLLKFYGVNGIDLSKMNSKIKIIKKEVKPIDS